jgi:hypothetical protein
MDIAGVEPHQRAILSPDLREDHAFDMDSEWWDHPSYEPCLSRRSGLLSDVEYDYDVVPYPQEQVPYWEPPPEEEGEEEEEEEAKPVPLPMKEYHPLACQRRTPFDEP